MKHTEYSKDAFKENIVYTNQNNRQCLKGNRVEYCYIHGELEDIVGYDCYNASINFILECLKRLVFLCTVIFKGKKYKCIVLNSFKEERMRNYVVLLDDIKGIKDAIKEFGECNFFTGGYSSKEFIKTNYKEIYDLFSPFNR